jgi:hypothetical protein
MGLSGDLGYFGLPEVLQVLSMSRSSGALTVNGDVAQGSMLMSAGRLVDARLAGGGSEGEEAFFALMTNKGGGFLFQPEGNVPEDEAQPHPESKKSIVRGLESLLLEAGARMQEE